MESIIFTKYMPLIKNFLWQIQAGCEQCKIRIVGIVLVDPISISIFHGYQVQASPAVH